MEDKYSKEILFSDTSDINTEEAINLSFKFKPTIFLHRLHKYVPMDIDVYLNHCIPSNWNDVEKEKPKFLTPNIELLTEIQKDINPTVHCIVRQITNNEHPLFKHYIVHYVLLYANQPDANICCGRPFCFTARNTGHEADVEWVSLLISPEMKVEYSFYACHGSTESMWFNENNRTNLYNDNIPIFVALDTNGSYPTGGTKWRLLGFHSDRCAKEKGCLKNISPLNYDLKYLPENHPWRQYKGNMGTEGIGSIGNEGRLNLPAPNNINFSMETQFKRRFYRYN
jgi:hypothetical protein